MTRTTTWLTAMPWAALLVVMSACGCGEKSSISSGPPGTTNVGRGDQDSGAVILTGTRGGPGGGPGADSGINTDAGTPPVPGDAAPVRPKSDGAPPPPQADAAPPPPPPGDAAPPPPPKGDAAPPPPHDRGDAAPPMPPA